MLSEPAFVASLDGRDAQRMALLSKECVSAVAGTERGNLARLRKMANVLVLGVAGPGRILLIGFQRCPYGVQPFDKLSIGAERFEHFRADPSHDMHVGDDIGRIADLHANL